MPAALSSLRRDLIVWMTGLRRIAVMVGFCAVLLQRLTGGPGASLDGVVLVILGVCAYNEVGRYLLDRIGWQHAILVTDVQVGLDVLALAVLLHFDGGITSQGLLFFAAPFFVYGAVLPFSHALGHAGATLVVLSVMALMERIGFLAHHEGGLPLVTSGGGDLVALRIGLVSVVNSLCAVTSHYLAALLSARAEDGHAHADEHDALAASRDRESARVRLLLDVARHASGKVSAPDLLAAVCETIAAYGHVARVEGFVWDAAHRDLHLIAAQGRELGDDEVRYPGDLPLVVRLRAGELVDFDVVPSLAMSYERVPLRGQLRGQRAFAVPMMCRESFEGALVVGYTEGAADADLSESIQSVAAHAGLALASMRVLAEQREDADVAGALLELSRAFASCLDTTRLWDLLLRSARETLGLPWAVAASFDERNGTFALVGAEGLPEPVVASFRDAQIRLQESPVLRELLSRREVVVADETQVRGLVTSAGWQVGQWLVVPLFRGEWVAGLLATGHFSRRQPIDRRQLRVAEGIGHHASIALQNSRLVADLEEADRLKSEFVSTMSHELRTPINVILGYTEMLRDGAAGALSAEQEELIARLDARGQELLELIEATLEVGRLQAGCDVVHIVPVDFPDLLGALKASTVGLPRSNGVAVEWEVPDARQRILTDRGRLALVIRNLVSNALKFTAEGKVAIAVALRGDALVIDVRDTGIGIDAEHLPVIFDMFRQLDGPRTTSQSGVGLGLYIVRQFVSRLGGMVEVESAPGRGSRFTVTFPGVVQGPRWGTARAA